MFRGLGFRVRGLGLGVAGVSGLGVRVLQVQGFGV